METPVRKGPITGTEGAEIELNVAAEWTKNHRDRHPDVPISQFFGIEIVQRLIQQPGCLGIRIYNSNSEKLNGWQHFIVGIANFLKKHIAGAVGVDHFILVGVTETGMDQLPGDNTANVATGAIEPHALKAMTSSGSILVEQSHPCPGSAGCPQNVLTGN